MGDTRPCDRDEIPLQDLQSNNGTGERNILQQDRTIPAYAREATELGRERYEREARRKPSTQATSTGTRDWDDEAQRALDVNPDLESIGSAPLA